MTDLIPSLGHAHRQGVGVRDPAQQAPAQAEPVRRPAVPDVRRDPCQRGTNVALPGRQHVAQQPQPAPRLVGRVQRLPRLLVRKARLQPQLLRLVGVAAHPVELRQLLLRPRRHAPFVRPRPELLSRLPALRVLQRWPHRQGVAPRGDERIGLRAFVLLRVVDRRLIALGRSVEDLVAPPVLPVWQRIDAALAPVSNPLRLAPPLVPLRGRGLLRGREAQPVERGRAEVHLPRDRHRPTRLPPAPRERLLQQWWRLPPAVRPP